MRMRLTLLVLCLPLLLAADTPPTVGFAGRLRDVVLPGSELEPKQLRDRKTPVVLRVLKAEPVLDGFRYDIEYIGLEPGAFDLREHLQRKDGSSTANLPEVRVTIASVLPPGHVLPNELEARTTPRPGGYRLALILGGIVWCLGLLAILFVGRHRRKAAREAARPKTLADHLRPLVEDAVAGRAVPTRLADLERALVGYWTRKLGLLQQRPIDAMAQLRRHDQAGPLLVQLEAWLHRPAARAEPVNVASLLEPYRHLPPDALEAQTRA